MEESKSQPQPENSEGLLAGITSPTDVVATQEVTIDHRVPEESDTPADRPAWWPENFWKKEDAEPDLEAIAKSWTDLRKQISQGKHKAPADGNYDYAAFGSVPDTDPVRQQYVWKNLGTKWNPYQSLGTPLLSNIQSAHFYPLNFLPWSWQVLLQVLLGGLFMIAYLRHLKLSPSAQALVIGRPMTT